jgi:bifunctional non-homologous end joining protein LigD
LPGCQSEYRRGRSAWRQRSFCLPRRELILDGEIIAVNDGRIDFLRLMRGQGHIVYAVFDVLWINARDLRGLPLTERKKRLHRLLPEPTEAIVPIMSVEEHGFELLEAVARLDLEGIVAKRKGDPYNQRVRWWKVKNPLYTQGEGRGELFERGVR